jgi:tetratricopeptide (TPR) repeat protein
VSIFTFAQATSGAAPSDSHLAKLLQAMPGSCQHLLGGLEPQDAFPLMGLSDLPSADFNALGASYAREKRYECAVAAFKASLKIDPSSWETHDKLALAYAAENAFEPAAAEFRAAIRQKPDSYMAHNGLGLALERLGQLESAAEEFTRATEIKPDFFYGPLNLAEVSLQLKRYAAV